jgi:hypothetical protein
MADTPQLIVAISARLDQFEKQLKEAGLIAEREIKNIETKTSQIAIGSAIGVGAVELIKAAFKEIAAEIEKAVNQMLSLGAAARKTGLDFETIQRIGGAARQAGIGDADMFKGLDAAAAKMDEMNRHTTRLSEFLDQNNIKYKEQNGLVVDVNKGLELAATLMGRAGSEFEKIEIARMFGLTEQWVSVLGDGVAKFREMKGAAANVNSDIQAMVAHMTAIRNLSNTLSALFAGWGTSIVTSVLPALDTVFSLIAQISQALARVAAGGVMEGMATTLSNEMGRISAAIKSARVEAERLSVTVNKPGVSGNNWSRPIEEGFSSLQRFDDQLSRHIGLLQAEAAAVGKTVGEREALRATALLEEAARRDGLTVEQALTAERQKQIELAKQAAQQNAVTAANFNQLTSASRELGSALSNAFADAVLEGKKLNDVFKDLTKTLARAAINRAFGMLFDPAAGGGGSAFMKLFGRQAGGPVSGGTPYLVGERGPELFVPNSGGMVLPNSVTKGGLGGNTFAPITNIDARGSTMSEQAFRAIIAENNRRLARDIARAAPARQSRFALLGT